MDIVDRVDGVDISAGCQAIIQSTLSTLSTMSTTKNGNPADSQQTVICRFTL